MRFVLFSSEHSIDTFPKMEESEESIERMQKSYCASSQHPFLLECSIPDFSYKFAYV